MNVSVSAPRITAICCPWVAPLETHLIGGKRRILIDSGISSSPADILFDALDGPPDLLLLTHGHEDHFGGAAALRAAYPDMRIAAHDADRDWIESRRRYLGQLYTTAAPGEWSHDEAFAQAVFGLGGGDAVVDILLEDGDTVDLGDGVELTCLLAPAHSPGHLCLWEPRSRALITGDALQGEGVDFGGVQTFPLYRSPGIYRATLNRLAALDPEVVYSAHLGTLDREGFARTLELCHDFRDRLDAFIVDLTCSAPAPMRLSEVAKAVQMRDSRLGSSMQVYRTPLGHLQEAARAGRLRATVGADGVTRWQGV